MSYDTIMVAKQCVNGGSNATLTD